MIVPTMFLARLHTLAQDHPSKTLLFGFGGVVIGIAGMVATVMRRPNDSPPPGAPKSPTVEIRDRVQSLNAGEVFLLLICTGVFVAGLLMLFSGFAARLNRAWWDREKPKLRFEKDADVDKAAEAFAVAVLERQHLTKEELGAVRDDVTRLLARSYFQSEGRMNSIRFVKGNHAVAFGVSSFLFAVGLILTAAQSTDPEVALAMHIAGIASVATAVVALVVQLYIGVSFLKNERGLFERLDNDMDDARKEWIHENPEERTPTVGGTVELSNV